MIFFFLDLGLVSLFIDSNDNENLVKMYVINNVLGVCWLNENILF